jgi:hypothetical protein
MPRWLHGNYNEAGDFDPSIVTMVPDYYQPTTELARLGAYITDDNQSMEDWHKAQDAAGPPAPPASR